MEGPLAREHLVEDRAEREDVGPRVGAPSAHLFGRHVPERPEDDAGLGAGRGRGEIGGLGALLLMRQLGEAEVEDLDAAVVGDEEVFGLEVAVDDAFQVRGREPMGDLQRAVDCLARREPPACELRPERLAFEELLDDVGSPLVRADVVDRGDVGVVEDARRLRLLLEAPEAVGVGRERSRQHLDRHFAAEPRILRAVDLSHSPGADLAEDLVRTETGTGGERHRSCADSIRRARGVRGYFRFGRVACSISSAEYGSPGVRIS